MSTSLLCVTKTLTVMGPLRTLGQRMWARFRQYFKGFPAQEKVAQLMVTYGLRVHEGSVYAGEIKLSDTAMARAAGVDRRVVTATVDTVDKNGELRAFFDRLRPVWHLRQVAPLMNWGAIEIVPTNASKPGLLGGVAAIIAQAGLSIRQAIMDDPEIVDDFFFSSRRRHTILQGDWSSDVCSS